VAKTLAAEGEQDGGGGRLPWNNDGPLGGDGSINSESILLDWLCTEGNYTRYRGKDNNGTRKKDFCDQIARKIKEAGIRRERTAKQIQSKIEYIENSFRKAHDWTTTETGTGLQEHDVGTFRQSVERICPYYYTLVDVFADRASAQPTIRSDMNLDSTDDEDNDEDNNDGQSRRGNSEEDENSSKRGGFDNDGGFEDDDGNEDDEEEDDEDHEDDDPARPRPPGGTPTTAAAPRTPSTGPRTPSAGGRHSTPSAGGRAVVPSEINASSSSSTKRKSTMTNNNKKKGRRGGSGGASSVSDSWMDDYSQVQKDNTLYRQATLSETERHNKEIEAIERKKMKSMNEMERHNKEMEAIERSKTVKFVWEGKQKEMEYKRSLHEEYLSLRKTMPDKRIAKIYPDMAQFFENDDDDDDDDDE
jgi:hypothetical protein